MADFVGGGLAAFRERADFGGDDGKPFAALLRARRLDGRIQREHARLPGDFLDN